MADDAMTFVPHSSPIDMTTWEWGLDKGETLMEKLAVKGFVALFTDTVRDVLKEDPPRLWMPYVWAAPEMQSPVPGSSPGTMSRGPGDQGPGASDGIGGPAVTDPLMLYLSLPLSKDSDNACHYRISLEAVLEDFIECIKEGGEESRTHYGKVSARLRELAAMIDAAAAHDGVDE